MMSLTIHTRATTVTWQRDPFHQRQIVIERQLTINDNIKIIDYNLNVIYLNAKKGSGCW